MRGVLGLVAAALLAGCGQKPPPQLSCNFVRYRVEVPDPAPRGAAPESMPAASAAPPAPGYAPATLGEVLRQAGARPAVPGGAESAPAGPAMLFMSGGGQRGAFGAGFLDGWREARGGLPAFDVVTGISTGAILATWAFTGDTAGAVRGYAIARESELVTPFPGGLTSIVQKGARADLVPLRGRLAAELTPETIAAVADVGRANRRLLVGAVDVDSGDAVAFDMTEMASRWVAAPEPQRANIKACYIEAIVASSSVPPAAPPAFIDNIMYIDGGARFGMFSDQIGALLLRDGAEAAPAAAPSIYLIVNGTLRIAPECNKVGQTSDGAGGCTPPAAWNAPHKEWDILSLGLRSVDVLQNQVYRFSAQAIERQPASRFRWIKIEPAAADFAFTWPAPTGAPGELVDSGTRTCAEWSARDEALDKPLQFHPRYMRCLAAYGKAQGLAAGW